MNDSLATNAQRAQPSGDGLVEALERARAAIVAETRALRANDLSGLAEHHQRKDQSLLELTRRANRLNGVAPPPEARATLQQLRAAIIENQAALRTQLHAARAVSDILMNAIADEESDRTYTMASALRARKA